MNDNYLPSNTNSLCCMMGKLEQPSLSVTWADTSLSKVCDDASSSNSKFLTDIKVHIKLGFEDFLRYMENPYALKYKPACIGFIVVGVHFGDEGKGKIVNILTAKLKAQGYHVLSIRGQGGGNAGHTVIDAETGKEYHFHYLTSGVLDATVILLGAGMEVDPIRLNTEAEQIPEDKRERIFVDERAVLCTDFDRAMDAYLENCRKNSGKPIIGTTKSGVGPSVALRAQRDHITFADAKACNSAEELYNLFAKIPNIPDEVRQVVTMEYAEKLYTAVQSLNVVNSQAVYDFARHAGWAFLLEASQAHGLDNLFGNSGHYVTSTHTTAPGAVADAGLSMEDFRNGFIVNTGKAYSSKVGAGPFVTKFDLNDSIEKETDKFIHDLVGEFGVTTGRLRDLGWFDAVAYRTAISRNGSPYIALNCADVIGMLPYGYMKICNQYRHIKTGRVVDLWPYAQEEYEPVWYTDETGSDKISVNWDIYGINNAEDLPEAVFDYLKIVEKTTGGIVRYIGTGGSSKDIVEITNSVRKKHGMCVIPDMEHEM